MVSFPRDAAPQGGQTPMQHVACYLCGADDAVPVCEANDDLTGKPGTFTFVRCGHCDLVYQNPRVAPSHIQSFYGDEYIAHRKKSDWGLLTRAYTWAMGKHDRDKVDLVRRYVRCDATTRLLDVGCGAGTYLGLLHEKYGCQGTGVDFVDLSHAPSFKDATFFHGTLIDYAKKMPRKKFDVITMWHFLEHDYDPIATLQAARRALKPGGHLIIEVPRLDSRTYDLYKERWPGWQAPQHTAAYTRKTLLRTVQKVNLRVVEHLPYGAFPPYFYLFSGAAFKRLKGRGLNLSRAIYPYFLGQLMLAPVLLFDRHLNLAMQTVVCRKGAQ